MCCTKKIGIGDSMFPTESNMTVFGMTLSEELTAYETEWKHLITISEIELISHQQLDPMLLTDLKSSKVIGMVFSDRNHQLHRFICPNI